MNDNNIEREKLCAVQAVFENAVKNNTIDDLRPYTDPDFSYVSFTDRSFSNFGDFSEQWSKTREELVGSGAFTTNLDPEPSLFIDNIAVCHGNSKNHMVDKKGNGYDFTSHWTVVFKRTNDEWKVLRAHNSLNPFSNPMLERGIKTTIVKTSTFAFILGGTLCLLLAYLIQN